MEPISADMAEPMRPAMRMAIMTGASSLHIESPIMPPRTELMPRSTRTGPVCRASTPPMKSDKTHTISKLAFADLEQLVIDLQPLPPQHGHGLQRPPKQNQDFADILVHQDLGWAGAAVFLPRSMWHTRQFSPSGVD